MNIGRLAGAEGEGNVANQIFQIKIFKDKVKCGAKVS